MISNNVGLGGTLNQNTIINNPSNSFSIVGQNNTVGFHVSNLGTVGIGLTTPQGIFHIAGRGTVNQNFRFDWASNDSNYKPTIFTLRSRDNSGVNAPVVDGDALFMQEISGLSSSSTPYSAARWGAGVDGTVSATSVPGYLYFATTAQGDTGATERLRIASNGNVGIGTTKPLEKLHINNGNILLSSTNSPYISKIIFSGNDEGDISSDGSYFKFRAGADGWFNFTDSQHASLLYADATSHYIGLGTTNPSYTLDVNGKARISDLPTGNTNNVITHNSGLLQSRTIDARVWGNTLSSGSGSANYSARWLSSNTLGSGALYDNGTRVGIGTDNPTGKLTITSEDTYRDYGAIHLQSSSSGNRNTLSIATNNNENYASFQSRSLGMFQTPSKLLLNPDGGNVGIGTTNPLGKLSVTDDSTFAINLDQSDSGTRGGLILGFTNKFASINGLNIVNTTSTAGPLLLNQNGGKVGIGTTNPGNILDVTTGSWNGIGVHSPTNGGIAYLGADNSIYGILRLHRNNDVNYVQIRANGASFFNGGNVGIGHTNPTYKLQVAGNAANTTGVWTNYSDSRLKNSIVSLDLSDSLSKITRLNPVAFNWNDPVKNAEFGRVRGFIAQEMETVIPEWVITDATGYKAIQPIGIDAMLVASIKELNTKIEGLDITADGSVVVNYNVSDEVLATLGYDDTKNELENGSYSLTDSLGQVVTRLGQFGELAVGKIKAGFISSKAIITDNLAAKDITSDTIVTGDLVSTQIGTTELTALKIGASEASFSTLYADQIINPEGNISDVMASKIGNLREEIKSFIASASATTEATPSAIAQNAETWDTSVPTDNLELTELDNLTLSGDLVVGAQLIVTGQTLLQNAAITDMLTVGQIALTQNILETTADTLFIQPSGQGSVDILNGRLLISSDGTIRINSDVIVSGSLTANILKADEIETQKLNIAVATTSAESTPSADSPSQNVTNDATAGFVTLATGQTEVTINNSQLTTNSMVYLTPNGSTQNQVPYIKNKTENNFTIAIDSPLDHDVNINWWLIN